MTLRRVVTIEADSITDPEQLSSTYGTQPSIIVDDETGGIYVGGVLVNSESLSGFIELSGDGNPTPTLGNPSLLDIAPNNTNAWAITVRNKANPSGEGLVIFVDENGDAWIENAGSDGTVYNSIILRGVANGSFVRFGPDQTHGVSCGPLIGGNVTVGLDGNVIINGTTGNGAVFSSVGGGNVVVKPVNFSTSLFTQLLPNFSGTVAIVAPVPASAAAAGTPGMIAFDSGFFYYCVANSNWKRAALSTW